MARLHVWVTGRVQGVFFRDSTRQAVQGLALTGWVRNLPDGRVEAVFQGEKGECQKALDYVKSGPPAARVDHVETQWEDEEEKLGEFRVRY
jgi:acylphosphatase